MNRYSPLFTALLLSAAPAKPAWATFQVLSWNLTTGVQDFSGPSVVQDVDRFLVVTNDWQQASISQVGSNTSQAEYNYSWIRNELFGGFQTDLLHEIRTPEVSTVARGQIFIQSSESIRIAIEGSLDYWHTPGDESSVDFNASVREVATGDYAFQELRRGGNLYLLPSASSLSFSGEAILESNTVYRLQYVLDCSNTADAGFPPSGILDASGFVNFMISPIVPEPSTLACLLPAFLVLRFRRR